MYFSQFHRGLARCPIDGLKDLFINPVGFIRLERQPHFHVSIGHALHSHPDGSVPHIRVLRFFYGVVVIIDDFIKVLDQELSNNDEPIK